MTDFDESKHPRGDNPANTGRFATKGNSAPEVDIGTPFTSATTFAEVDGVWKKAVEEAGDSFYDGWKAKRAAVSRGQELRKDGLGISSELPTTGFETNHFAGCQNDAELADVWDAMTEEPLGDGEASRTQANRYYARLRRQFHARRHELVAAGVIDPSRAV